MPFEPPVIRAVLPAIFRSMKSPLEQAKDANYEGADAEQQQGYGISARRLDHATNAFAVADLGAETEIARSRLDIDRAARSGWL